MMSKKNMMGNRNWLILSASLLIFLVLLLGNFSFNSASGNVIKKVPNNLNKEINMDIKNINNSLTGVGNDLLFLSVLPDLSNLINSQDPNLRRQFKLDLQKDFLNLSRQKKIYYKISYIDEKGEELVRVNSQEGIFKVITKPNLQNEKETSSFQNAMRLRKGEMFMSPLNLNLEDNKIENKETNKNPEYIPVIRYATPLFDDFGNSKGIILISIYANHFLKKIQENHLNGGNIFLLNGKGFYLSNRNKSKEFEFMFNKKSSFFEDYPERITTALLANKGQTFLETKNLTFSFKYIYPTFINSKINKQKWINFQRVPIENHYWVLVVVSAKNKLNHPDVNK